MADALDSQQIQTVLEAGERYNRIQDHQQAYDTVFTLVDGGSLQGETLGWGELIVGEACLGLGSYDAAMHYLELAMEHAGGEHWVEAERLLSHVRNLDNAQGVELDGVDGEQEAEALLRTGEDALERIDFDVAWNSFSAAYNGLHLTRPQLSRAAVGLAECYVQAGQADEAEGYLQVAENQEPEAVKERIAAVRQTLASIRAGFAAVDGGVDRTELDEVNRAALAASRANDINTGYDLFLQLYQSPALPVSDRGRVALNLGVLCLYSHSFDAAHQFLTEAAATARPEQAANATRMLEQLAEADQAADIVAGIDLSRDIVDAD